ALVHFKRSRAVARNRSTTRGSRVQKCHIPNLRNSPSGGGRENRALGVVPTIYLVPGHHLFLVRVSPLGNRRVERSAFPRAHNAVHGAHAAAASSNRKEACDQGGFEPHG